MIIWNLFISKCYDLNVKNCFRINNNFHVTFQIEDVFLSYLVKFVL